jgi:hypothetical protein
MYVCHKIEVCPYDHCCSGKAIIITQLECVYVALGIWRAMCMSWDTLLLKVEF